MSFKRRPPEGNVRRVAPIGNNLRGVFTNKAGRTVQFESFAEQTFLLRLDRSRDVKDYVSQPERFDFLDAKGKSHRYVPDFKVWKYDGSIEIHEITRTERQDKPSIRLREEAARSICQSRGWKYIVHTEQILPGSIEAVNLLTLLYFRPQVHSNQQVRASVEEQLQQYNSLSLRSLLLKTTNGLALQEYTVFASLCHLLWHLEIAADITQPLFMDGTFASDSLAWSC